MINSTMNIALSGMRVGAMRANVAAQNIANVNNASRPQQAEPARQIQQAAPRPAEEPGYRPQALDQSSTAGGGVTGTVRTRVPGVFEAFQPNHPEAGPKGNVAYPDVNMAEEAMNLKQAERAYAFGAEVVRTAEDMSRSLLDATRPD